MLIIKKWYLHGMVSCKDRKVQISGKKEPRKIQSIYGILVYNREDNTNNGDRIRPFS